jgi:competence protein ComEC
LSRLGWRTAAIAGVAAGLAASALLDSAREGSLIVISLGLCAGAVASWRSIHSPGGDKASALGRALVAASVSCLAGLFLGEARLKDIASEAAVVPAGTSIRVTGTVTSWARESDGATLLSLSTPDGNLALRNPGGNRAVVGEIVRAEGVAEAVPQWRRDWFERRGIETIMESRKISSTGGFRGGVRGVVDVVRVRSEQALSKGIGPSQAALARGFVLGQDQEISPSTEQEFRRSGLAHLLAVSGQNVVLLSILAWPFLALLGLRLPGRLIVTAILIVLYVFVAGAGPSIQRAGVMGVAALAAGLAGRPAQRLHALLLAAAVTLAINPLSISDPGWLLSFAATAGIMLWARPLGLLLGSQHGESELKRSISEAAAVTTAATLATAPLSAALFGTVSLVALPANLIAAPAVAPAMWLGMLSAALGQISQVLVGPFNWLNALCLAYIEQLAHWFGSPDWAMIEVGHPGPVTVGFVWAATVALVAASVSLASRHSGLGMNVGVSRARLAVVGITLALAAFVVAVRPWTGSSDNSGRLMVCALDVGQGDAILLDPPGPGAALVDAGPPDSDIARQLDSRGVSDLSSLIVTHDQSDHAGGVPLLLRSVPVDGLVHGGVRRDLLRLAREGGADTRQIAEGGEIRVGGGLRLSVLWPPAGLRGDPGLDPNSRSLVLLATWRHFTALLTGDAESESVPIEAGPVDLLKVAHHGSQDSGLDGLLERSVPKLALISVGSGNSYGHPADETVASLTSHLVPVMRTDRDGSVGASVGPRGWRGGAC